MSTAYVAHGHSIIAVGEATLNPSHTFRVPSEAPRVSSADHDVHVTLGDVSGFSFVVVTARAGHVTESTDAHALHKLMECDPLPQDVRLLDETQLKVVGVQTPAGPYPLPQLRLAHAELRRRSTTAHPLVLLDAVHRTFGRLVRADAVVWILDTGHVLLQRDSEVSEIDLIDAHGALEVDMPYALSTSEEGPTHRLLACPPLAAGSCPFEYIGRIRHGEDPSGIDSEEAFVVKPASLGDRWTQLRHHGVLCCIRPPSEAAVGKIVTLWDKPTPAAAVRSLLRAAAVEQEGHAQVLSLRGPPSLLPDAKPVLEEVATEEAASDQERRSVLAVVLCEPTYGQPVEFHVPRTIDQTVQHPPFSLAELAQEPGGRTIRARFEPAAQTPAILAAKLFFELPRKLLLDWTPHGGAVNAYGRSSWLQESRGPPDSPHFEGGPRGRNVCATNLQWTAYPLAAAPVDDTAFEVADGLLAAGSVLAFEELQDHPALFVRLYFADGTVAYRVWLGERVDRALGFRNPLWENVVPVIQPLPSSSLYLYMLTCRSEERLLMHSMLGMSERRMPSGQRRLVVLDMFRRNLHKMQVGLVQTSGLTTTARPDPTEQYAVTRSAAGANRPAWAKLTRTLMLPNAAASFWRYSVIAGLVTHNNALSTTLSRIYPRTNAGLEPTAFDPALRKSVLFPLRPAQWSAHRSIPRGANPIVETHRYRSTERTVEYRSTVPLAAVLVQLETAYPVAACGLFAFDDEDAAPEDGKAVTTTVVGMNGAIPLSLEIDSVAQRCVVISRTESAQTLAIDAAGRHGVYVVLARPEVRPISVAMLRAVTLAGDSVYVHPRIIPVGAFAVDQTLPHAVQIKIDPPSLPFSFTIPFERPLHLASETTGASIEYNAKTAVNTLRLSTPSPATITLFDPTGGALRVDAWPRELVTEVFAIQRDDSTWHAVAAPDLHPTSLPRSLPDGRLFFPEPLHVATWQGGRRIIEQRFGVSGDVPSDFWIVSDVTLGLDPCNVATSFAIDPVRQVQNTTLDLEPVPTPW